VIGYEAGDKARCVPTDAEAVAPGKIISHKLLQGEIAAKLGL
jgi:hypothetical protein